MHKRLNVIYEVLDPDVVNIDKHSLLKVNKAGGFSIDGTFCHIRVRESGEFKGKALYLGDMLDWEIGIDSDNVTCLVPMKKRRVI